MTSKFVRYFLVPGMLLFAFGCSKGSSTTLWVYTSLYPHVVEELKARVAAKFPGKDIRWYQGGSENVAGKVNRAARGKNPGRHLLTSDLFWYEDLRAQKLLPYLARRRRRAEAVQRPRGPLVDLASAGDGDRLQHRRLLAGRRA